MRQVGTLPSEPEARRFAAWLVSQRIEAHAEQEASGWVVWVRDEDQLPAARDALVHFREHSSDPKYSDAQRTAEAVLREEEARRRQAQSNVVEMRGRWGAAVGMSGVRKKAPLTKLLIGACVVVALLAWNDMMNEGNGENQPGALYLSLVFVDPRVAVGADQRVNIWASIEQGQVWRVVTPVFIHYGLMHIVFNVFGLYSFGSLIEDRRGSRFLLLLVLALAVLSDIGQAMESSFLGHIPLFGGMSGVVYGLFGYVFIKSRFDSKEQYYLSPGTAFLAMLWFTLCILRDIPPFDGLLEGAIPPIANSAHAVGLLAGAAIAYLPLMVRKPA
jgi:rhomboid protease GlpG